MVLTFSKQLPGVAYYLPKNLEESCAELEEDSYDHQEKGEMKILENHIRFS